MKTFFTTFHTVFEEEVCDVAHYRFTVQGIIHNQMKHEIKEFWLILAWVDRGGGGTWSHLRDSPLRPATVTKNTSTTQWPIRGTCALLWVQILSF